MNKDILKKMIEYHEKQKAKKKAQRIQEESDWRAVRLTRDKRIRAKQRRD